MVVVGPSQRWGLPALEPVLSGFFLRGSRRALSGGVCNGGEEARMCAHLLALPSEFLVDAVQLQWSEDQRNGQQESYNAEDYVQGRAYGESGVCGVHSLYLDVPPGPAISASTAFNPVNPSRAAMNPRYSPFPTLKTTPPFLGVSVPLATLSVHTIPT